MNPQRVVSNRFPYLPVRLHVGNQTHDLEALLDTGFDGDIAVPAALVAGLANPLGYFRWSLADGSGISAPYYEGALRVGPVGPFAVAVMELGAEPIIGVGAIEELVITLDHAQRVIVEP
jgi:predicted aspartyl protease